MKRLAVCILLLIVSTGCIKRPCAGAGLCITPKSIKYGEGWFVCGIEVNSDKHTVMPRSGTERICEEEAQMWGWR